MVENLVFIVAIAWRTLDISSPTKKKGMVVVSTNMLPTNNIISIMFDVVQARQRLAVLLHIKLCTAGGVYIWLLI